MAVNFFGASVLTEYFLLHLRCDKGEYGRLILNTEERWPRVTSEQLRRKSRNMTASTSPVDCPLIRYHATKYALLKYAQYLANTVKRLIRYRLTLLDTSQCFTNLWKSSFGTGLGAGFQKWKDSKTMKTAKESAQALIRCINCRDLTNGGLYVNSDLEHSLMLNYLLRAKTF